jgi:hypothetical protein
LKASRVGFNHFWITDKISCQEEQITQQSKSTGRANSKKWRSLSEKPKVKQVTRKLVS